MDVSIFKRNLGLEFLRLDRVSINVSGILFLQSSISGHHILLTTYHMRQIHRINEFLPTHHKIFLNASNLVDLMLLLHDSQNYLALLVT